jgi:hypothetical protein
VASVGAMSTMDVGGEITLGSYLFTLIEPHPGHEVTYNRWYERDHFYAGCMIGPWLFSGGRFVATRDLKAMRIGEEPDLFGEHAGSTLSLYWVIDGKMEEHFEWGTRQVHWLHDNGRMYPEREHVHTNLYSHRSTVERDADGCPVELALEHRFQTLVTAWIERDDKEWPADPDLSGGVTQLVERAHPAPMPEDAPLTQKRLENTRNRQLTLWFADAPAEAVMAEVAAWGESIRGTGRLLWAGPFTPTIPGTDTYMDQL